MPIAGSGKLSFKAWLDEDGELKTNQRIEYTQAKTFTADEAYPLILAGETVRVDGGQGVGPLFRRHWKHQNDAAAKDGSGHQDKA